MGLSRPIEPSVLFLADDNDPERNLDELAALDVMRSNHPSFLECYGEGKARGSSCWKNN